MRRVSVLVMLAPDDPDTDFFRIAVGSDPLLTDQVDLRFAAADTAAPLITDVEVLVAGGVSSELVRIAVNLKWISFWSAGMESKATPEILDRNIMLTNASGVHGPNISEHVLAMMLMFTRRMHLHIRSQAEGKWQRTFTSQSGSGTADELTGKTLGIVGLGRIGEALLKRAKAFDMRVVATKRDTSQLHNPMLAPDTLYSPSELGSLLEESDHVCVALPYTIETHHLLNAGRLALMKPSAYLYNIARGKIIDENALINTLQEGKIAGAGLDVFEQEPLPEDSPLWKMDNVIITPHVSGLTPHYFERKSALFTENLRRFVSGDTLNNLYDSVKGY